MADVDDDEKEVEKSENIEYCKTKWFNFKTRKSNIVFIYFVSVSISFSFFFPPKREFVAQNTGELCRLGQLETSIV